MIHKTFSEFQQNVAKLPHRMLGLDIGTKTVGVSVSDSACRISSPLKTIQRKNKFVELQEIKKITDEYSIKSLVVGYPLHMNGKESDSCGFVLNYLEHFSQLLPLPILLWDERMSTVSAERVLLEADMSRAKRKEHVDAIAASVILQSFLDFLSYQ